MSETLGYLIPTVLIGAYVGVWIHEGTHYLFGRHFGGSPRILRRRGWLPRAVAFTTSDRMSDAELRWAGGATIIWLIAALVIFLHIQLPSTPTEGFLIGFAAGSLAFSPSDLLALAFPGQWRQFERLGEDATHRDAMSFLHRGIRDSVETALYSFGTDQH